MNVLNFHPILLQFFLSVIDQSILFFAISIPKRVYKGSKLKCIQFFLFFIKFQCVFGCLMDCVESFRQKIAGFRFTVSELHLFERRRKVYINQPQHLTEIKWTSIIVLLFYPSQYTKRSMYPDQNNNIINVHSLFLTRDKHTNRRI